MTNSNPIEQTYEAQLRSNPQQPHVWCALGEARLRANKLLEARNAFENALRLEPALAQAHFGLANVCKAQGKPTDAIAALRAGLGMAPGSEQALLDLGVLLAEQSRIEEAIACWQKLQSLHPDHVKAHHNLGVAMAQKNRPEEAIRHLERALQLKPDYAEAYFNLANVLCSQKSRTQDRRAEGVERFLQAIRIRPDFIDSFLGLGSVLTELGRAAEATLWLRQAIRLCESAGREISERRNTKKRSGKPSVAPPLFANSAPHPQTGPAYNQLGLALTHLKKYRAAEAAYCKALSLQPDFVEAHSNLGNLFQELGRLPEALTSYELALIHEPESATTKWNRALSLLQAGNFKQGWREYEWRWHRKQTPARPYKQLRWDGSPLAGRTLFIYMEQGLGDMIQFMRFVPQAKQRGGRVVVECPHFALPLLSRCSGVDEMIPEGLMTPGTDTSRSPSTSGLPRFDVQIPLMSLPSVLGTTLDTLPNQVPYLFVDDALIDKWRHWIKDLPIIPPALSRESGKKYRNVGICWQGNLNHRLDRFRSIALHRFAPLAGIPGVRLVSLQRGPGAAQILQVATRFKVWEPPHSDQMHAEALLDTAALMKNLDLVISVDTGTAHLAGALGVPVWVPLSAIGEWRWLLERNDSPWYPTMRLFRQKKLGEWNLVFRRMARELTGLLGA